MIYFLFGICFCLAVDKIIEWVQWNCSGNKRDRIRYDSYTGITPSGKISYRTDAYDDSDRYLNWKFGLLQRQLNNLEDQWCEFKEKYPDLFGQDEESEEED